jgi:HrpA-like RNA helicase
MSNINPHNNKPFTANYERIQRAIQHLPVFPRLPQLAACLGKHNVLILIGETGSGKTTQFPKYILEKAPELRSGLKLALTQNRVLAANAVS